MRIQRLAGKGIASLLLVASLDAAGGEPQEAPVVEAVKQADTNALRALLQQRADVNSPEADGTTALHWAVHRDDVDAAELLIRAGADVGAANRYGIMPLSLACVNGSAAIIELLLNAGANPNTTSPEGETALMTAARTGTVDAVKALLAHGADVNAKERWRGSTALMWAAAEGHAIVVQTLIEGGIDNEADIDARSNGGLTPLLFAVREGRLDAVRVLLAAGADVNEPARDGTSALVLAIINAHYELAAFLLDNSADPNASDPRGSALHAVAWMRRPGRSPRPPPVPTGNLDSLTLARTLLAHGANPNVRIAWTEANKDGFSLMTQVDAPPDIAIGRNYLIFAGATPFYLAAKHSDIALLRLLVANGADPLIPTVQNVTPLMAAAGIGFWQGESPGPNTGVPESDTLEAVKLVWELGGDVQAVTDFSDIRVEGDGITLLHSLPLNRVEFRDLGDARWGGSTALHGAALRGVNTVVRFLLEKGATLDTTSDLGWTPLMLAEGMYIGQTEKEQPHTADLIRQLTSGSIATNPRQPQ